MNPFYEHHHDSIRFAYRCFDRTLLNGLIQPFQQPERVVGFFNTYREPASRGKGKVSVLIGLEGTADSTYDSRVAVHNPGALPAPNCPAASPNDLIPDDDALNDRLGRVGMAVLAAHDLVRLARSSLPVSSCGGAASRSRATRGIRVSSPPQ
jgi:hypothetical protein